MYVITCFNKPATWQQIEELERMVINPSALSMGMLGNTHKLYIAGPNKKSLIKAYTDTWGGPWADRVYGVDISQLNDRGN